MTLIYSEALLSRSDCVGLRGIALNHWSNWRRISVPSGPSGAGMSRLQILAFAGLAAALLSAPLHAQTRMYKCIENGKVIYSERPLCAAARPGTAGSHLSEPEDLPPDGVDVAAEIQAEFEREVAAKRAEQAAGRARAAAEAKARTVQTEDCHAEMSRKALVWNSAWDGSVRQVEQYLKRHHLRDPDSYEALSWSPVVRSCSGYIVKATYRARNGFGGMNVETAIFELDRSGNVVGMVK